MKVSEAKKYLETLDDDVEVSVSLWLPNDLKPRVIYRQSQPEWVIDHEKWPELPTITC